MTMTQEKQASKVKGKVSVRQQVKRKINVCSDTLQARTGWVDQRSATSKTPRAKKDTEFGYNVFNNEN